MGTAQHSASSARVHKVSAHERAAASLRKPMPALQSAGEKLSQVAGLQQVFSSTPVQNAPRQSVEAAFSTRPLRASQSSSAKLEHFAGLQHASSSDIAQVLP
jgi:hypothetical protein